MADVKIRQILQVWLSLDEGDRMEVVKQLKKFDDYFEDLVEPLASLLRELENL